MNRCCKSCLYKSSSKKKKKKPENTDEATVDLIGNKIVNKITSAGKTKRKEKEHEIYKKFEYN